MYQLRPIIGRISSEKSVRTSCIVLGSGANARHQGLTPFGRQQLCKAHIQLA